MAVGFVGDWDGDNGRFLLAAKLVSVAQTILLIPHTLRGGICGSLGRERVADDIVLIIVIANFKFQLWWEIKTVANIDLDKETGQKPVLIFRW